MRLPAIIAVLLSLCASCALAADAPKTVTGRVMLTEITGRAKLIPFAGHEGWLSVYPLNGGAPKSARIGADASFSLEYGGGPAVAIASLDRLEVLSSIVTWSPVQGKSDIWLNADYSCYPAGYPEVWDKDYPARNANFWQTFVPRSANIYSCTAFDGPRVAWWGNKVNFSVHREAARGPRIGFKVPWGETEGDDPCGHHTEREYPRVGYRHGDVSVEPGKLHAIRIGGYRGHGAAQIELNSFIRPDKGDGYADGSAFSGQDERNGDLCLIVQGDANGQIVENQIRNEEWNVVVVKRKPVTRWGQTFVNHGAGLCGVVLWGLGGPAKNVSCTVRVREDGPEGKTVGSIGVASGLPVPYGPYVRYADTPGVMPGYEHYYSGNLKGDQGGTYESLLFQAAFKPGAVPLSAGKTYYLDLQFSAPVMLYGDGDFYTSGHAYYDGQKVESDPVLQHSDPRWTVAMTIVTYAAKH